MFEIGKRYEIRMTDPGFPDDGIHYHHCEAIAWEQPLLKLRNDDGTEWIVNTSSPQFVGAEERKPVRPGVVNELLAQLKEAQGAS